MHPLKTIPLLSLITASVAHPLLDAALPSISSRGFDEQGQIGQFASPNCSGKIFSDEKKWVGADGHHASIAGRPLDPTAELVRGTCMPWYPVLAQQAGPSVGINFGANENHIKQVQFFKSTRACATAERVNRNLEPPAICCHKDAGGLLGVMNANGSDSDFGATKDLGFKGSMCAQIGPGYNQTLWEMRYFISR